MDSQKTVRPTGVFIVVLLIGFGLYFAMNAVQSSLSPVLFDYMYWFNTMKDSAFYRFLWLIGDGTEPHFHKTIFGGIGALLGSLIAYILDKHNSKYSGIPISYDTGLWPWILLGSWVSLAITGILFGGIRIGDDPWIPTFVPYVCVASAVILIYGGSFTNMLTGAILGSILTTPITIFLRYHWTLPNGIPGVIASVSGMWIGGILVFELCNLLPWMKKIPMPDRTGLSGRMPTTEQMTEKKNSYFVRRMLADYSEPFYVGNEIAGTLLIIGSLISWFLNPMHPYYGTGWFPALLLCQIITGAVGLYIYWPVAIKTPGFPSFVAVVSVAPGAVLTYGPSLFVIIVSAIMGALLCPVIALWINKKIPLYWGGMIGTTASMAFCSFGVGVFIKFLLSAFPGLAQ